MEEGGPAHSPGTLYAGSFIQEIFIELPCARFFTRLWLLIEQNRHTPGPHGHYKL